VLPAQSHRFICAERVNDVEIVGISLRLTQRANKRIDQKLTQDDDVGLQTNTLLGRTPASAITEGFALRHCTDPTNDAGWTGGREGF